ncbi:J domain-containing protein [Halosegnis longus]|uniref:J domain-containing protein n=1 Tax=Halosegnis longus TaxID=2216012 RepID=UPI00129E3A75|nr:J domain-containing protein [Halosegnis longus]
MNDLDWPDDFDRTPASDREPYPHRFRVSRSQAFDNIVEELGKLGAVNVRVETAAPHTSKAPHRPYADRDPDHPGVVAYFERGGDGFAVPCDRWDRLRDNAQAIAKYLDAKRAIERYGVATVGTEMSTQALPSGDDDAVAAEPPAHDVLGVASDAPDNVVRAAARSLKKEHHPDAGGDEAQFKRVVDAEEAMLDE